jgi:glycosyltransferase involved in cell wall biosynthesis
MNIMLIIPEMCVGGAQRSMANLSLELAKYANVYLIIFNKQIPVAYRHGGSLISLEVYPSNTVWGKLKAFRQRVKKTKSLKRELNIDVSISFLEGADYVNILSKQSEKVVLSVRGSKIHDVIMQGHLFFLRTNILIPALYKRADGIVAVNKGIAKELTDNFGVAQERVHVIHNFYDFEAIQKLASEPRAQALEHFYQDHVLITTGRLAPEKRLDFLLYIFAALKKKYSRLRFMMVGDGPQKDALIKLCDRLYLKYTTLPIVTPDADIIFTGNQENVFKFLRGSTVYVMNSSSEGFPNGLIEAMACNVPVVSSDCFYGPKEILESNAVFTKDFAENPGNGVLIPFENDSVDPWIKAIDTLLGNPKLRSSLTANASNRILDFDRKRGIQKWLQLLSIESDKPRISQ